MKTFSLSLVFVLLLSAFWLQCPPVQCAVPAPGTTFYDRGNGITEISKKESPNDGTEDGTNFLGEVRGDEKFLVIRHGKHNAKLGVFVNGKLLYTMTDIALPLPWQHFNPGETYKGYDFYLSPDHLSLFVVRGLVHASAVAYLYTRSGPGQMRIVRPSGLRLDDAALHYYCRHKKVDEDLLGSGARMLRFVQWDTVHQRIIFTMFSASNWGERLERGEINAFWYTAYDLKTGRFKIITNTKGLPEPQVG